MAQSFCSFLIGFFGNGVQCRDIWKPGRREKGKSSLFGTGDTTVMELEYPNRTEVIAPDIVIGSAAQSNAKGAKEDTADGDDYQLVTLNTEWKCGS